MNNQTFLAVLGRQAEISLAELESLFGETKQLSAELAEFPSSHGETPDLRRLGGVQKIAEPITTDIQAFVKAWGADCPAGKIVLGVSDYTPGAKAFRTQGIALKFKRTLTKLQRNVRVLPNSTPIIASATSFHNHMWAPCHLELIKLRDNWYRVVAVQDISAYAKRDWERPARDAKVGMLPPKLAQILINLCGPLPAGTRLLDPFCGTGVVLQEAALMGYRPYGTDLSERMIEYSRRNLEWLGKQTELAPFTLAVGDATSFRWEPPIGAVACEAFLGQPMSLPPAEIKLKQEKQRCREILREFLANLSEQITSGTPVVIAIPAWLRPDGHYERLNLLDDIEELRYNVRSFKNNLGQNGLLYYREGQIVAREIIVLRKK